MVERGPDTVRGPDVVVARREQRSALYVEGSPALAIEILSPSNRAGEIRTKVREYLTSGAELVWIVDDRKRIVTVHYADGTHRVLNGTDPIDGGSLMPDFALTVGDLFAEI